MVYNRCLAQRLGMTVDSGVSTVIALEKCVPKPFACILLPEDGQNNVRTQKQNRLYNRCNGKKIDADLGSMARLAAT